MSAKKFINVIRKLHKAKNDVSKNTDFKFLYIFSLSLSVGLMKNNKTESGEEEI